MPDQAPLKHTSVHDNVCATGFALALKSGCRFMRRYVQLVKIALVYPAKRLASLSSSFQQSSLNMIDSFNGMYQKLIDSALQQIYTHFSMIRREGAISPPRGSSGAVWSVAGKT